MIAAVLAVVQDGDQLGTVAKQFGVPRSHLRNLSNIVSEAVMEPCGGDVESEAVLVSDAASNVGNPVKSIVHSAQSLYG